MQDLLAEARKRGLVPEGYEDLFKPPEASTPLSFSDDGGTPAPPPLASPTAPRSASVIPSGGPKTFGEVIPPVETRGFAKDPMADYAKQILSDVGETVSTFPERQAQFMGMGPKMSPELEARVEKFGGIRAPRYTDPDKLAEVGGGLIGSLTSAEKELLGKIKNMRGYTSYTREDLRRITKSYLRDKGFTSPNRYAIDMEATKLLTGLSRKGAVLPELSTVTGMYKESKAVIGPHPEVREIFELPPMSKEEAMKSYLLGRSSRTRAYNLDETGPIGSGHYLLTTTREEIYRHGAVPSTTVETRPGPPRIGVAAREFGFKGKLRDILKELEEKQVIKRVGPETYENQAYKLEHNWGPKVQEFFDNPEEVSRRQRAMIRSTTSHFSSWSNFNTLRTELGRSPTIQELWNRVRTGRVPGVPVFPEGHPLRQLPMNVYKGLDEKVFEPIRRMESPPPLFAAKMKADIRKFSRDAEAALLRRATHGEMDPEQREMILRKKLEEGLREYSQAPSAKPPMFDTMERLVSMADENGVIDYVKAKKQMPSEFQRFSKELGDIFKNRPTATVSQLREAQLNVGKHKYRYDLVSNYPNQKLPLARSFFPDESVHYLQIWGHPSEVEASVRVHAYPANPKEPAAIPAVGWFRIKDLGDTWAVEEIQSDLIGNWMKEMNQNKKLIESLRSIPEESRLRLPTGEVVAEGSLEKALGRNEQLANKIAAINDWADYGLSTLLEEARKNGISHVMIANPKAVKDLWSGHLGDEKSISYYRDLPRRFGFKLDFVTKKFEPSSVSAYSYRPEEAKFSYRVPVFIATGAAGTAAAKGKKDEE